MNKINEKPHTRYRKVYFDEDWLEDWLMIMLEIEEDALRSNSMFAKDKSKRAVFFWAMKQYGGMSATEICRRYGQYNTVVHAAITSVVNGTFYAERTNVVRSLEPYLPHRQMNEHG
jgi:hypothetical protein